MQHKHTRIHSRARARRHAGTHARTQACRHARTHARTHAHTHKQVSGAEKKDFEKRMVFNEGLKELKEAEWRTETGSWFRINGAW